MYIIVLMVVILIIVGQAGGNHYKNKGGGSNYFCLPNDHDNGKPYSNPNDVLYGAEYEVRGIYKPLDLIIYPIKMSPVLYVDVEESILFS